MMKAKRTTKARMKDPTQNPNHHLRGMPEAVSSPRAMMMPHLRIHSMGAMLDHLVPMPLMALMVPMALMA
jgi:hypothetical protein